jgi:DNA recombination protein RmuC
MLDGLSFSALPILTFCFGAVSALGLGYGLHRRVVAQYQQWYETQYAQQQASADMQHQQLQQQLEQQQHELDSLDVERDRLTQELRQYYGKLTSASEKLRQQEQLRQHNHDLSDKLDSVREEKSELLAELREVKASAEQQLNAAKEKHALLENAEERLRTQFEQLANQVFEQKVHSVDEQNKMSLESLLGPLKSQLEGFKKQVTDSFGEQAKERHTLIHEIKNLQQLNADMTREAHNLTQALKGDNKQQGNWGEVVLARVLEESGLREGHEYHTQVNLENEQGKRYQPDVIVKLPQDKDVVIDAKMALVAYERYYNAESTVEQDAALKEHVQAIRAHIRGLGRKDYHQLHGVKTLDYVLMFIPVEPAFQIAIEADPSLIREAMDNNIMLVSPTTLLVALRTINNLWRYEYQNQNAKQIAEKASKLYDKVRLFVSDMEGLGSALGKANDSYHGAMNKLSQGRGNILRQAEGFKALGVEVKRDISPALANAALTSFSPQGADEDDPVSDISSVNK